jgi:hypothetical protein
MYERVSSVVLKVGFFQKIVEAIGRIYYIRDGKLVVVSVELLPDFRSDKPVSRTREPPENRI